MEVSKKGISQSVLSATLLILFVTVLAQDQVLLLPSQMRVVYAGGTAQLECLTGFIQRPTATIEWFFNETLNISSLNNVTADLSLSETTNAIRASLLGFAAVPVEYNMTRIHCHVEFTTGSPSTSTTTVLLVQGLLDAVDPMIHASEDFTVILNWTAPFTLLGASEITYCVDVVDLTTRRALLSECGTNITEFTYTAMPPDFACGLSFTVTPVNVVGNGTSATVGLTNLRSNPLMPPELVNLTKITPTEYVLEMSAPVCDAKLRFFDVDTGEIITLEDTDVTITDTNITFSTQKLKENRNYNVTITASNTAGNTTPVTAIGTRSFTPTTMTMSSPKPAANNVPAIIGGTVGGVLGSILLMTVVVVVLCVWYLRPNNKIGRTDETYTKPSTQGESVHYAVVDRSQKLQHGVESVANRQDPDLYDGPASETEASSPSKQPARKPDINYMEVQPHTHSTTQVHEASCHDVQYSTIAGSSNNGQTYAFVAPKSITVDTSHEVSKAVNEINYSAIQPQGLTQGRQQAPDVLINT